MSRENLRILRNSALYAAAGAVGCSIGSGAPIVICFVLFFLMFVVAHLLGFPWRRKRAAAVEAVRNDDAFYGLAAHEVADHRFVQPLMAKAYSLALGDPAKTKALYIAMRVEQLKAESQAASAREAAETEACERGERAAERRRQSELAAERRRRDEAEAQMAGDAWNRSESMGGRWNSAAASGTSKASTAVTPPPPGPPLSPEELDRIIESLKKALDRNSPKV